MYVHTHRHIYIFIYIYIYVYIYRVSCHMYQMRHSSASWHTYYMQLSAMTHFMHATDMTHMTHTHVCHVSNVLYQSHLLCVSCQSHVSSVSWLISRDTWHILMCVMSESFMFQVWHVSLTSHIIHETLWHDTHDIWETLDTYTHTYTHAHTYPNMTCQRVSCIQFILSVPCIKCDMWVSSESWLISRDTRHILMCVMSESPMYQVCHVSLKCVMTHLARHPRVSLSVSCIKCVITHLSRNFDRKTPPPPGGFPIYYVPSSRTVCKRTPLGEPGTNPSRGVLLHTVLDEGT